MNNLPPDIAKLLYEVVVSRILSASVLWNVLHNAWYCQTLKFLLFNMSEMMSHLG